MDRWKFGAKSSKRKLGTNRYSKENSEAKATPAIVKMCVNCLTSIRSGVHHRCNANQRFENLMNLLPQSTLNRVAASVIDEKLNDSQDGASILSLGGRTFQVPKRKNSDSNGVGKHLDLELISDMRAEHNLSLNQTQGILKYFRTAMGRSAVESHAKEHLQKKNSQFKPFFDISKTETGFPIVFCCDVGGFLDEVCGLRGVDPTMLKFGADTGRGQFKVTLSVVDNEKDMSGVDKFKSTSVQKLFLLAATFDPKEQDEPL